MKVLVADDSRVVLKSISDSLKEWGYDSVTVDNGLDAFKTLERDPELLIAILDWQMPGLDGPEVCAKLRTLSDRSYVYTIVLTTATDGQTVSVAMDQGADDYLLKASPRTELQARLKAARRIVELQKRLSEEAKRLAQSQRMESVGNLAAGMAHELNTPIQYISHNLDFIAAEAGKLISTAAEQHIELPNVDLKYLADELIPSLKETQQGIEKVKTILEALRQFSASSLQERSVVAVNELVSTASVVCRNEWQDKADLQLDLTPLDPKILCIPQDISQIALQLILNAAQAIGNLVAVGDVKGKIVVKTEIDGEYFRLTVSDTGCGIPAEIREKIFDPFFTTKRVGSGIGNGLALIYSAAVERHSGQIDFHSEVGHGTTFCVKIPISQK